MEPPGTPVRSDAEPPRSAYLELVKRCLLRTAFPERWREYRPRGLVRRGLIRLATAFSRRDLRVVKPGREDAAGVEEAQFPAPDRLTLVGRRRLDHLEWCVRTVVSEGIPGDLVETGIWRGGCVILMRAALEAFGDRERVVWAADSFEGLPRPDPARFPADGDVDIDPDGYLAVSLDEVKRNLDTFGLLDDRVRFLPGWFKDTLPAAPIERLSVLRMDGDLYESTTQALDALYPRLSPGGFAIADDYGPHVPCRRAVDEWRAAHGVVEPLEWIDEEAVCWRRER